MAFVTLQREGAIGVLTLNRPDNANVLNLPMARELLGAVRELEADPSIRAVLLTGAGKHFCFGGDLRGMLAQSSAESSPSAQRADINHREDLLEAQRAHTRAVFVLELIGQIFGVTVALACTAGAIYTAIIGAHPVVSIALVGLPIAAIIKALRASPANSKVRQP